MNSDDKVDLQKMKYEAKDKELLERGAKTFWNKLTRFLDKFAEVTFILCLTGEGIWNLLSMFIGDDINDKGFSILRTLLSFYFFFLAWMVF